MKRMFYTGWMLALCFFLSGWNNMQAQTYEKLWKQVEQAQQKSLPQTVVKLTEEICRKALDEKNSPQLLKAYLCRAAFQERLTPDSLYARLNEMERWVTTETDEAERAILHSLLASEYADYWQSRRYTIAARKGGQDTPDKVTAEDIELTRIRFTPETHYTQGRAVTRNLAPASVRWTRWNGEEKSATGGTGSGGSEEEGGSPLG